MSGKFKMFSSKTDFERMREHRDAIRVEEVRKEFSDYTLPEKPSDIARGAHASLDRFADKDLLSTHFEPGKKLDGANEYAMPVPDGDLKYAGEKRQLSDGFLHTYDLNELYEALPGDEDDWKPAPKKAVVIS